MSAIIRIWEKLSNIGILSEYELGEKIRIRLTNQMAFVSGLMAILYGALYLWLGFDFFAYDLFLAGGMAAIPVAANHKGHHNFAKMYHIAQANFQITLFYIGFGKDSAMLFAYYPILGLPMLYFRLNNAWKIVTGIIITVAFIFLSSVLVTDPLVDISEKSMKIIYYFVLAILVILQVSVLYYFSSNQVYFENQILRQNQQLHEYSEELITQNEELSESYSQLSDSRDALKKININLESIVDARTQDLQKSLAENKQTSFELQEILASMPIIVWVANRNGDITYFNNTLFNYTGADFENTRKNFWENWVFPEDLPGLLEESDQVNMTGRPFKYEFRIKRWDGQYRWHLGYAFPIRNTTNEILKWIGTAIDIHDQKLYNQHLFEKNKELLRINNDLDTFVYTASHDLKVPVANIEGLLSAAKETFSDETSHNEDTTHLMELLDNSVVKLKKTIEDLTEIGRIQREASTDQVDVDLTDLANEILSTMETLIKKTHTTVNTDFKTCSKVYFSRSNFRSILFNLITNSIKYRKPGIAPQIDITCTSDMEFYILKVKDNGMGIAKDQLHKIFGLFKRVHTHVEGTGVGLYLVKRIIENAGGRIEVESEEGRGSTFTLYIPLKISG